MNHVRLTVQGRANWVHTHAMGEKGRITVGRGPDNDVDLSDPHSSSQHAMIARKGGGYIIRDLGSRNGTFINGRKIESDTLLNHGDQIRVGLTEMQFLTDAEHSFSSVSPIPPPPESEASAPPDEIQEFPDGFTENDLKRELLAARDRIRLLETLNEFDRSLAGKANALEVVSAALIFICRKIKAENGFIMQIDPKSKRWSVRARFGDILDWSLVNADGKKIEESVQLPMSMTIVEQVIHTSRPVVSSHALQDPRLMEAKSIEALGIHSCVCHPLLDQAAAAGVVYADRRMVHEPFDKIDQKLFDALVRELNLILYH